MFYCQFCNKELKSSSAKTQHEKYYCSGNPNKQEVIKTKFYSEHKKKPCVLCGKLIDVANLARHQNSCGKPKSSDFQYHVSHEGLDCIFCGKACKNKNSLTQHELRCKENPERKNYDSLKDFNAELANLREQAGLNIDTCERVTKSTATLRKRYEAGEIVSASKGKPGTFRGRQHSEESKAKIRASTLKYIEDTFGTVSARYNINACKYIDFINGRFNWHLQHAENGGEIRVCNYFLDGYDAVLNIAFEYDEPRHYLDIDNNVLCERDILRMQTIIEELGCRFIRYNEKLNLLYEIDQHLIWHAI